MGRNSFSSAPRGTDWKYTRIGNDETLVTPYSFPKIDQEILRIADDKAYLDPEVFDRYAAMQSTYRFRYAQCANKGGIGTRVIRRRL